MKEQICIFFVEHQKSRAGEQPVRDQVSKISIVKNITILHQIFKPALQRKKILKWSVYRQKNSEHFI